MPHHPGQFTEREINSYRAAFGAIAGQLNSMIGLERQLDKLDDLPSQQETYAAIGRWQVCAKLLKLGQSEILLCRQENDFAVMECFRGASVYTKKNGATEILLRGSDAQQLTDEFMANAQLTLEFMASNLTAKAQKVVWEQFPDYRPSQVIAAISERCRQAVSNDQKIFQSQTTTRSASRGMKI